MTKRKMMSRMMRRTMIKPNLILKQTRLKEMIKLIRLMKVKKMIKMMVKMMIRKIKLKVMTKPPK